MGFIKLTYYIQDTIVSIDTIIQEFEYGSTFALYQNKEDIIAHKGSLKWIDFFTQGKEIRVIVQDDFFHMDFLFEKFMTIFVYNLLDFGNIYIKEIDIANSTFKNHIHNNNPVDKFGQGYLKGTIFKPYYHLSINQKVNQAIMWKNRSILTHQNGWGRGGAKAPQELKYVGFKLIFC